MSQAKHYTTLLGVQQPDGSLCECEFKVTPIGSYNTALDSFWMQLLDNFQKGCLTTVKHEEVGS